MTDVSAIKIKLRRSGVIRTLFAWPCAILMLVAVMVMTTQSLAPAYASHEDPAVLADADGALDLDPHVEGIHFAMRENWLAAWMMMTEQLVTVMMEQMFILGTFLDAEQQLETQRLFQQLTAEAHKDFHPSFQMCQFGTNMRSLAASERVGEENSKVLDAILRERELLNVNLAGSGGTNQDISNRVRFFKLTYCDPNENNRQVTMLCDHNNAEGGPYGGPVARRSKDIDYTRMIDHRYTLDLNYLDGDQTTDEQDVISLANHLYGSTLIDFMPEQLINEVAGQTLFQDIRSIHAIRSVARHSYTKIVGMKAEGDQANFYEVAPFMHNIIFELGVPEDEIADFLGENPSYFAQMEVLTRKIYQSPEFFTNLYDKPANVRRVGVALQALEIMQDRDRFKSSLRREMLISLILELKLRKYQEDINSKLFATATTELKDPEY